MFPDPEDLPTPGDLLDLQRNPAFLLVLARLQRQTYAVRSKSSDDKEPAETEIDALGIIDRTFAEIERKGQSDA